MSRIEAQNVARRKRQIAKREMERRKQRIAQRLAESSAADRGQPMTQSDNIHYEVSNRVGGTGFGGMAAVHAFVRGIGLVLSRLASYANSLTRLRIDRFDPPKLTMETSRPESEYNSNDRRMAPMIHSGSLPNAPPPSSVRNNRLFPVRSKFTIAAQVVAS